MLQLQIRHSRPGRSVDIENQPFEQFRFLPHFISIPPESFPSSLIDLPALEPARPSWLFGLPSMSPRLNYLRRGSRLGDL